MTWEVVYHPAFAAEQESLPRFVRVALGRRIIVLRQQGPSLGRPQADTLRASRHANMKELRLNTHIGVWRVAFIFDPNRQAILLLAGNKEGENEGRFYRQFIREADARFNDHLNRLRG